MLTIISEIALNLMIWPENSVKSPSVLPDTVSWYKSGVENGWRAVGTLYVCRPGMITTFQEKDTFSIPCNTYSTVWSQMYLANFIAYVICPMQTAEYHQ